VTCVKVSIVTPLFNRPTTIERCIQSVLNQSYKNLEHIVMDAGSDDATLQVIRKYQSDPRLVFDSQKDKGIYDGMNRGLAVAKGEWILFLGADDYLSSANIIKDALENVGDEIGLVLASAIYENGRKISSQFGGRLIFRNSIHHQGCFYRTSLFGNKTFDLSYRVYGDYDFNLYLLKKIKPKAILKTMTFTICANFGISDTPLLRNYLEEVRIRHKYYFWLFALPFDVLSVARFVLKKTKRFLLDANRAALL